MIGDTDVSPTVQNDQLTVGWADAMFPQTVPDVRVRAAADAAWARS